MTMLMALYVARWEVEAAREEQCQVAANQTRLARVLRSAGKARQQERQSGPRRPALKRLVGALASTGGLGCP